MSGAARQSRGQATVELLGVLPLLAAVVLSAAQLLAAGAAREQAEHAAAAGATALLQGASPGDAARAALAGDWRGRAQVRVTGRRVEVVVRPQAWVPGLASMLAARRSADAGPAS